MRGLVIATACGEAGTYITEAYDIPISSTEGITLQCKVECRAPIRLGMVEHIPKVLE